MDGHEQANRGESARFLLPFEPVEKVRPQGAPRVVSLAAWRHTARHALALTAPRSWSLLAPVWADFALMPYQLEPAIALLRGKGCRFLIADEVGLGKTVQAGLMIAELLARHPDGRVLVVAPAGLREQWCTELRARFRLEPRVFEALTVASMAARLPGPMNPWRLERLIVTSIDYIKRPEVLRSLEPVIWDAVVFDEAHTLCGRSDRASAASALASRARNAIMLTATPHSGDDAAFTRLCTIGDIEHRFPLLMFRRTRRDIGLSSRRRTTLLRVRPSDAEIEMHRALLAYAQLVWRQSSAGWRHADARLATIVLMRRACSSAWSLRRSVERRLALLGGESTEGSTQLALPLPETTGDEAPDAELARPGLRDPRDERLHLEQILTLARAASEAETKILLLGRLVRRVHEPLLVFTEYRDTLQQLAASLPGIAIAELHGGLTTPERSSVVNLFTKGSAHVLLATDAASEGLNLHHRCRVVVSLELPWTPTRLEQRTGRLDRLGQRGTVHAIHLTAAGTSEEVVVAKLARRFSRARAVLNDAAAFRWPDERQVAQFVVEGQKPAEVAEPASVPLPMEVVRPCLRPDADEEARRLTIARALVPSRATPPLSSRPIITTSRRRRRHQATYYWAFRLLLELSTGGAPWQPMLALQGTPLAPIGSVRDLRRALSAQQRSIERAVARAAASAVEAVQDEQRPLIELMTAREEAIAAVLQHCHARMAADLVQRGLFDRRVERAEAAQAALLDIAVNQTVERLKALADRGHSGTAEHELIFGIAVR